jgi:aspartyl-tRNA synthetase
LSRKAARISRKALDELQEYAKRYGADLAWIKFGEGEISSSLLKVLGEEAVSRIAQTAKASRGDAVLIVAGRRKIVASLGALRNEIAKRDKLIPENTYAPLWVMDFPMFELNEDDGVTAQCTIRSRRRSMKICLCCIALSTAEKRTCSGNFARRLTIRLSTA